MNLLRLGAGLAVGVLCTACFDPPEFQPAGDAVATPDTPDVSTQDSTTALDAAGDGGTADAAPDGVADVAPDGVVDINATPDAVADADAAPDTVADAETSADGDGASSDDTDATTTTETSPSCEASGGSLSFGVSNLDFKDIPPGQQLGPLVTRRVTITAHNATVPCISATVTGPFSFAGGTYPGVDGTCGETLEPGQSCALHIAATPDATETATGAPFNGTLQVTFQATDVITLDLAATPRHPVKVSTGPDGGCLLNVDGKAYCWGVNYAGELGTGETTDPSTPVPVAIPPSVTLVDIAYGHHAACAVDTDGAVWCWGDNDVCDIASAYASNTCTDDWALGAMGTHQFCSACPTPIKSTVIDGESLKALRIEAAHARMCALMDDGSPANGGPVRCWGLNDLGRFYDFGTSFAFGPLLGIDSTAPGVTDPTEVVGFDNAVKIDLANSHACAVLADGQLACWGDNSFNQLGVDGQPTTAVLVTTGATTVKDVAVAGRLNTFYEGGSTCIIDQDDLLRCWGSDVLEQLGNGGAGDVASPTAAEAENINVLGGMGPVVRIEGGNSTYCAVNTAGAMYCWGDGSYGAIPSGDYQPLGVGVQTPLEVDYGSGAILDMDMQRGTGCLVTDTGEVRCWGQGDDHRLGVGDVEGAPFMVGQPGFPVTAAHLASGALHNCAVRSDAKVRCWGDNQFGQVSGSAVAGSPTFDLATVSKASGVAVKVAAGTGHSCVLFDTGGVDCWGNNNTGQLGTGSLAGLPTLRDIDAGGSATCGLSGDGEVFCWGAPNFGQLGPDATAPDPTQITLPVAARLISVGSTHACAVGVDNGVYCWGDNTKGAVDGTVGSLAAVGNLTFSDDVGQLATGLHTTCVVTRLGSGVAATSRVQCWGDNDGGALFGSSNPSPVQLELFSKSGKLHVGLGAYHACIGSSDTTYCVGANDDTLAGGSGAGGGQAGQNGGAVVAGVTALEFPFQGAQNAQPILVEAGLVHTCALLSDGAVNCWGVNGTAPLGRGQLGSYHQEFEQVYGTQDLGLDRYAPVSVFGLY